jgi:dTMP kinase
MNLFNKPVDAGTLIDYDQDDLPADQVPAVIHRDAGDLERERARVIRHIGETRRQHVSRPLLVNIEGSDGAGKETLTTRLVGALQEAGFRVATMSFPAYADDSPEQAMLREHLSGKQWNPALINPVTKPGIFAGDRLNHRRDIIRAKQENDILVLDRYTPSSVYNLVLDSDKFGFMLERHLPDLVRLMWEVEYGIFELPMPDLTLYLEASGALVEENMKRRAADGNADAHERTFSQAKIQRLYRMALTQGCPHPTGIVRTYCPHRFAGKDVQLTVGESELLLLARFAEFLEGTFGG